ncbi:YciI family protein [Seonamhaeicola sediminis]|nr:YciI family protein [Seonamhaeicola sediminis]
MKTIVLTFIVLATMISCKKETTTLPNVEDVVSEVVTDSTNLEFDEVPAEKTITQLKEELTAKGFKTFDYVDEKTQDTILMQQYFMAFLKRGPIRTQNEEEAALIQKEHLAHLTKMYELGYADISGPFGDDGDIRGITIYNVPTLKMADSLAKADPAVKAGWLEIEVRPWWAAKGFPLR